MVKSKINTCHVYKSKPHKGWEATDPARSKAQACSFIKGGYGGADAIIVKTGKKGDTFPFTIYTHSRRR